MSTTSKKKILAFDQAARLSGWSYWENDKPIEWGTVEPSPKSLLGEKRLKSLYEQFDSLISKYNPDILLIENPVGGDEDKERGQGATSNWKTAQVLFHVQSLLMLLAAQHKVKLEIISPSSWQFTTRIHKRSRAERKAGAREFVEKTYKISNVVQDVCDSICIGYHYIEKERRENEVSAF